MWIKPSYINLVGRFGARWVSMEGRGREKIWPTPSTKKRVRPRPAISHTVTTFNNLKPIFLFFSLTSWAININNTLARVGNKCQPVWLPKLWYRCHHCRKKTKPTSKTKLQSTNGCSTMLWSLFPCWRWQVN